LFSFGKGAWNLAGERIDGELELRGLFFFPFQMVVTDVYNHRFHKIFSPDEGLNHILDRDDIFM